MKGSIVACILEVLRILSKCVIRYRTLGDAHSGRTLRLLPVTVLKRKLRGFMEDLPVSELEKAYGHGVFRHVECMDIVYQVLIEHEFIDSSISVWILEKFRESERDEDCLAEACISVENEMNVEPGTNFETSAMDTHNSDNRIEPERPGCTTTAAGTEQSPKKMLDAGTVYQTQAKATDCTINLQIDQENSDSSEIHDRNTISQSQAMAAECDAILHTENENSVSLAAEDTSGTAGGIATEIMENRVGRDRINETDDDLIEIRPPGELFVVVNEESRYYRHFRTRETRTTFHMIAPSASPSCILRE
ncbi:hypothetical protein QAD02_008105 [Eretmocerus hayati]|uniref:Uncharacterized protein n=1 Tax=Eretmocerus hayati TaxID=131215 RepID=A0ACC2N5K7_9HYME|nr:hypothetical protein QAD02_008105 [Eretmocerus hayati]